MLRHMTGDVAVTFRRKLEEWYDDTEIGKSCAKWHWTVVKYSPNPYSMRGYVTVIQIAFQNGVNLDELPSWKRMMRTILPEEFLQKMSGFTQVPQIAVMDETEFVEKEGMEKDSSEVDW